MRGQISAGITTFLTRSASTGSKSTHLVFDHLGTIARNNRSILIQRMIVGHCRTRPVWQSYRRQYRCHARRNIMIESVKPFVGWQLRSPFLPAQAAFSHCCSGHCCVFDRHCRIDGDPFTITCSLYKIAPDRKAHRKEVGSDLLFFCFTHLPTVIVAS